jgi:excisionase family DNA binding protein
MICVSTDIEDLIPHRPAFRVAEVAELLGLARASVYSHIDAGHLAAVHLGKTVLIPRSALIALLEDKDAQ